MKICKKTDREEKSERGQVNKSSIGRGAAVVGGTRVEEGGKVFCILRVFFFVPGRCLRDTGAD